MIFLHIYYFFFLIVSLCETDGDIEDAKRELTEETGFSSAEYLKFEGDR